MGQIKSIADLEDAIDEKEIPYSELIFAYKDFILRLIDDGTLEKIPKSYLGKARGYLGKVSEFAAAQDRDANATVRSKLWAFADEHKAEPDVYNLARALIFTYSNVDEWENSQDPIIYYFYIFLARIVDDIESPFVQYFNEKLRLSDR